MNRATICLRCGYPMGEIPEQYYNRCRTCHMCRTSEENKARDERIRKFKAKEETRGKTI